IPDDRERQGGVVRRVARLAGRVDDDIRQLVAQRADEVLDPALAGWEVVGDDEDRHRWTDGGTVVPCSVAQARPIAIRSGAVGWVANIQYRHRAGSRPEMFVTARSCCIATKSFGSFVSRSEW